MKSLAFVVIVVVSLWSGACLAQAPQTALALIEASLANADANAKEAYSYTFHEDEANAIPEISDETPTPKLPGTQVGLPVYMVNSEYRWSIQSDVLFIEGVPYRRVTGINGQKLPPDITALLSEQYDRAVAEIHALSPEQRLQRLKEPLGRVAIMMDTKQLTSSYSCKITGHDKVDRRPATVIKCKPLPALPKNDIATRMSGDVTLWVDDQQPFLHRTRVVLDHPVNHYGRGTVFTDTWSLFDGVWHETSVELDWIDAEKTIKNINMPTQGAQLTQSNIEQPHKGKVLDTFSDFKKFRIGSRIVIP
jgi:hypothetical protein